MASNCRCTQVLRSSEEGHEKDDNFVDSEVWKTLKRGNDEMMGCVSMEKEMTV